MELPEHLRDDGTALRRAYPDGVPDADYWALLVLLSSEFLAEEAVGEVVGFVARREPVVVVNDAAAAQSIRIPPSSEIERVRKYLTDSGFEFEQD
jgi:hypothetical protein